MKALNCMILLIIIPIYAWAANSLITNDDIKKMKKAGISEKLVNYLVTNQTCSIDADNVISYHNAGLKDEVIQELIQADAYRPVKESTVDRELKIIEGLKQAGFTDQAILEYLNIVRSNKVIDHNGDRSYRLSPPMNKQQANEPNYNDFSYPVNLEINQ